MTKLTNDKYYTPLHVVDKCISIVKDTLPDVIISEIIEPSAGSGVGIDSLKDNFPNIPIIAYDIEPERNDIIKADFLYLSLGYKKDRLIIGNPPFGNSNSSSIKFFQKACDMADYIAFIQPISQLNNNLQMYQFDLIKSIDLGVEHYTDRELHCCFNIYQRPKNWFLNSKPDYKLKDIEIKEYRRNGNYPKPENYDYGMCNWGNGSLGKVPKYVGEYAQEVYFYCYKKEYLPLNYLNLIQLENM